MIGQFICHLPFTYTWNCCQTDYSNAPFLWQLAQAGSHANVSAGQSTESTAGGRLESQFGSSRSAEIERDVTQKSGTDWEARDIFHSQTRTLTFGSGCLLLGKAADQRESATGGCVKSWRAHRLRPFANAFACFLPFLAPLLSLAHTTSRLLRRAN